MLLNALAALVSVLARLRSQSLILSCVSGSGLASSAKKLGGAYSAGYRADLTGLVGPEQRLQRDDDYVCVSLPKKRMIGGARRIAKIRFRDLSTKRSKNTRRVGPQRLDYCAKPSGHAPSPSYWGWVRHAHSVRMTVPRPSCITHSSGTNPSMVRLHQLRVRNDMIRAKKGRVRRSKLLF